MAAMFDQNKRLIELLGRDEMTYGVCCAHKPPDRFDPRPKEVSSRNEILPKP